MKKSKDKKWFLRVRGSYIPTSWQGAGIYMSYVAYIIAVLLSWYIHGHDTWRLLTQVIPLITGAAVLAQFVASKNAK